MTLLSYRRHRFPPEIIQHAIWLYLRFTLSYRDVEELLAERGVEISYETVRRWVLVRRRERKLQRFKISPIRPVLPQHACRRSQYLQLSTPSRLAIDAAGLPSRGGSVMVRCRRRSVRPDQPLPLSFPSRLP